MEILIISGWILLLLPWNIWYSLLENSEKSVTLGTNIDPSHLIRQFSFSITDQTEHIVSKTLKNVFERKRGGTINI